MTTIYIISSVLIVSLVSLVGVFTLSLKIEKLKSITLFFVSLSAGTLLGGAILHLLPEIIEKQEGNFFVWLWLLAGIVLFFVLEKIVCWRHCHLPTTNDHPHPLGIMNLIGDSLHNFIDGMLIAASFLVSTKLGMATTVAVIMHEIPQEIGDFGVLIHAGYSRTKALVLNLFTSFTALLGALLIIVIHNNIGNLANYLIPLTAGGFIYIATADLIPELRKDSAPLRSLFQLLIILFGIFIMLGLKFLAE